MKIDAHHHFWKYDPVEYDWPVSLVAIRYQQWAELIQRFIDPLSSQEQASIMGGTASSSYQLD